MIKRAIPLRVLLADDEEHMRNFVGQILASVVDCALTKVSDGAAAVDYCRNHETDLVILDINMPRMDGSKALPLIRALRPNLPIVMMTSIADEYIVEECLRNGASYYIRKDPYGNYLRIELETVVKDFFPAEKIPDEKA